MKIVFTGGGSGGHFYPIIAVAEEVREIAKEEKLVEAKLYFLSTTKYNERALFDQGIEFVPVTAGKLRRYFSIKNIPDILKTFWGVLRAIWTLYKIYPDVVFGKGGHPSFPVLVAARLLRIPIMIHESDTVPGRVNRIASKFATRIAVSYPETAKYFDSKKVAYVGNPIRKSMVNLDNAPTDTFLKLEPDVPVILILGGSQGAEKINDAIMQMLPQLVSKYQVIHQTGKLHFDSLQSRAGVILESNDNKNRYKPLSYLNEKALVSVASKSSLIISRAGSTIFEIAAWGVASIIVPIADSNGDHQRRNAFSYARSGAAIVVEEKNLSPNILLAEIERVLGDRSVMIQMGEKAHQFARPDAAHKIAQELIHISLEHE
ncbi:undecaprenyldiphospho-muramoylpentapeptide beta-N-acetylglucosaminyltransferase [Candidatus Wolfebacteria bacterium]|nr:MAG: undecaprenyldiphospho-muramoylpentapeptide beta-N-acetylglucosaminyltransferase [Candidatus Wolfebacteria bacterium]